MRGAGAAALAPFLLLGSAVLAQVPRLPVQVELRGDAIASKWTAGQGALGLTVPAGLYVRSGIVVGVGGGARGFDSRMDLVSRFSVDPFRQSRWAFYAGGGLGGRYVQRDSPKGHAYLLILAGIEGPLQNGAASGWVPAFELGLGGGARAGFAVRRGINGRR